MSKTYRLACDCGRVTLGAHGAPKMSLYCHCASCRALYGVDVLSATGWAEGDVSLPPESALFVYKLADKQMTRYGCPHCGMIVYGRHRPGIPVIPHGVFRKAHGGRLPDELAPTLHLFYEERVIDVADDLPKSRRAEALG